MTTTNTTNTEEALVNFARGVGAQKRRWRVGQADAVRFAIAEYPQLAELGDEVRRGWRREDNELRGRVPR